MAHLYFLSFFITLSLSAVASPLHVEVIGEVEEGVSLGSETQSFGEGEIQKASGSDLGSFLRQQGLALQREGGEGQNAFLYLRGAGPDQVLVLIDGVPVNDPSNTDRRFDFSRIPLSEVRRVEIIKGSQSVRYGSQALGGVVRIWTQASQEKRAVVVGGKYGSHESYELNGSLLQPLGGGFHAGFSGQHYESSGYSAATDGAEDDAHRSQSGAASLSYGSDVWRSQYSFRRLNQRTDIDRGGGVSGDDPNFITRYRQDTHSLTASAYPSAKFTYQFLAGYSKLERHSDNFPDATSPTLDFGDYRGDQTRLALGFEYDIFEKLSLGGGVERGKETAQGVSSFGAFPSSSAEKTDGFLTLNHDLQSWFWNAGARVERHSEFGSAGSQEAALGVRVFERHKFQLRFSQGTKWPSLFQLYDPTFGNKDLSPERSSSLEAAWFYQDGGLSASAVVFENKYKNLVTFDPVTMRSVNEGRAEIGGFELEAGYSLGNWHSRLRYQYIEPRQKGVEQDLLRRSRQEFFYGQTYQRETWDIGLWAKYKGPREDVDPVLFSRKQMPSHTVWGMDASWRWPRDERNMRLWASVENIADLKYEEVAGYRAVPRVFWLGASWEL